MGIEKFFNSLKKSYGTKIINKLDSNTYFPTKYFLLDFNSIIHNISQSVSTSLIYLKHVNSIANIYPNVYILDRDNIINHINNLRTDFIIKDSISLPDHSVESDQLEKLEKLEKDINFSKLELSDIDETFFKILGKNLNLDKYIIHKVANYVYDLTKYFPNLELLYLAIDGVPSYAKMIEQKKRRTIGYILEQVKIHILELYKSELDIDPNINSLKNEIYYNHYNFEQNIRSLKFNKNKISPGTQFMSDLESYVPKYLNHKYINKNIKIELDPNSTPAEGEKKIVLKIHQLKQQSNIESFVVYSPDADVILLMLIELGNLQINIMRYDQQLNQLDMINILELKRNIIDYMKYSNLNNSIQQHIIKDIVILFTILGNDFLPRINIINTNKHIRNIFDAYNKLNPNINESYKFRFIYEIDQHNLYKLNFQNLKQFFINLKANTNKDHYKLIRRPKDWKTLPNQIINSNAIGYYQHIFNIENLVNTYEPSEFEHLELDNNYFKSIMKYLVGFMWLGDYYLNHNMKHEYYYYKYQHAPTLDQLINILGKIIHRPNLIKKLELSLESSTKDIYFTPVEQLVFISPINILDIVDKKLLNDKLISDINLYDQKYISDIDLQIKNFKINLFDYLDCSEALYLSKCELKKHKKISGYKILKLLRSK